MRVDRNLPGKQARQQYHLASGLAPQRSAGADTVCQPSAEHSPMAGCSTNWSSE